MAKLGLAFALELRDDALSQDLTEFDAPLIERVDVPDGSLGESAVLVQRTQLSERGRGQTIHHDGVGGPFAFEPRCGTSQSGVPSALTCSRVFPKASASVCANTFACSISCCRPSLLSGCANAMKSQGMSRVPWWIS